MPYPISSFPSTFFTAKFLNLPDGLADIEIPEPNVYIPVLDDSFSTDEVQIDVCKLKPGKAAGLDGVCPRLLPDSWIILVTFLFSVIFYGSYPFNWILAKFFTIYKKGARSDPANYRESMY